MNSSIKTTCIGISIFQHESIFIAELKYENLNIKIR
jgi:hypothetical protein